MSLPKRIRSRRWCFTINNYTEDQLVSLSQVFQGDEYVIGREVGEEGTKHLQGYLRFKNQKDFDYLKKLMPEAHIEKCKGKHEDNIKYCTKDGNYITNIDFRTAQEKIRDEVLNDEYENVVWKEWQQQVIDIIDGKPDKRKIFWYFEKEGNVGKSYLCKYLVLTRNVIICDGKKDNIFNQVSKMLEQGIQPSIVLLDIPRTYNEHVNYSAIESLKNGCMYSGKYEGTQCVFKIPHVVIFSNEEPDYSAMSADRWDVRLI